MRSFPQVFVVSPHSDIEQRTKPLYHILRVNGRGQQDGVERRNHRPPTGPVGRGAFHRRNWPAPGRVEKRHCGKSASARPRRPAIADPPGWVGSDNAPTRGTSPDRRPDFASARQHHYSHKSNDRPHGWFGTRQLGSARRPHGPGGATGPARDPSFPAEGASGACPSAIWPGRDLLLAAR